jgi:hypothetical protein
VLSLPKWKKDANEFTVGVNHNEIRGYQSSIPKPVMETLGNPDKITFVVKPKNKVEVQAAKTDTAEQ